MPQLGNGWRLVTFVVLFALLVVYFSVILWGNTVDGQGIKSTCLRLHKSGNVLLDCFKEFYLKVYLLLCFYLFFVMRVLRGMITILFSYLFLVIFVYFNFSSIFLVQFTFCSHSFTFTSLQTSSWQHECIDWNYRLHLFAYTLVSIVRWTTSSFDQCHKRAIKFIAEFSSFIEK